MIRTLYIKCNAATPALALQPFFTFVNSPSSLRVIDVPKKIGKWKITDVYVTANYPGTHTETVKCVLTGGAWVGTIPAPTASGTVEDGYAVTADGIDETGTVVSGYVLGKGMMKVLGDESIIEDGTSYRLTLREEEPDNPQKGDVVLTDSGYRMYDGEEWITFGGYDFSSDIEKKATAEFEYTYFTGVKTVKQGKTTDFDRDYAIVGEYETGTLKDLSVTVAGQTVSQKTPISDKQVSLEPYGSIGQRIEFALTGENEKITLHSIYNDIDITEDLALVQLENYGPNQSVKYKTVAESIQSHMAGYALSDDVKNNYQPKGNYLTAHQSLSAYKTYDQTKTALTSDGFMQSQYLDNYMQEYAKKSLIPTKTSQLTNDSNYLTAHQSLTAYATKFALGCVEKQVDAVYTQGFLTTLSALESMFPELDIPEFSFQGIYKKGDIVWINSKANWYECIAEEAYGPQGLDPALWKKRTPKLTDAYSHDNTKLVDLIVQASGGGIPMGETIATQEWVEGKNYLTEHQSLTAYALSDDVKNNFQPKGNYLTSHQSLEGYATESWVEGKNYLTAHQSLTAYYDKDEVDGLIENAGKVKTVNDIEPDENGNIEIQAGGASYTLVDVTLTEETDKRSCTVQNCTVSRIVVDDSTKPVYITLPAQAEGNVVRDILLRIEVTCAEAPQFAFIAPDDESVEYECVEDDWATLEPGINILSFTETKRTAE